MRLAWTSLVALTFLIAVPAFGQGPDLREQFSTRSLEAANHIKKGIDLAQARKSKEALAALEAALVADPGCQMAHYWKGIVCSDLGKIEECIAAYKKALSDDVRRTTNISAQTAVNLAITLAKLDENDEANLFFTRAILEDSANTHGQRGKAYRNMAISYRQQKKTLSAAISLALAFQDKAPNITPAMLREFFEAAEDQEVARILAFDDNVPKLEKREAAKLAAVSLEGGPTALVSELLADPQGQHVLAIPSGADHYFVISTSGKLQAKKVMAPNAISAACLADGHLYIAAGEKLEKLEVTTGKSLQSVPLKAKPASLTVLPAQGLAFFSSEGVIHSLNLRTGNVSKTDLPGHLVVSHPNQKFIYSCLRPERRGQGGYIIINGRMLPLHSTSDWLQATLFKGVVTPTGVLLAEARENVASNARRLSISADGSWVAVAGGGGFRPRDKERAGYGVGVLGGHSLAHLQGFFATDAYPEGVCFNPVSHQVTAIRGADAKVYHLANPAASTLLTGKFRGAGVWSGNGRYLVLATDPGGVTVYENTLTDAESKRAETWMKAIKVTPIVTAPAKLAIPEPVKALASFELTAPARADLSAVFAQALAKGRTDRPARWSDYPPHARDDGHRQAVDQAAGLLAKKEDNGIAIFRIRQALKKHPDSAPLQYFLGEALRLGDQAEEAEKNYLAVLRADQGRTELSIAALNRLAGLLRDRKEELAALHCLATSLSLDRASPATLGLTVPLLRKNKFDAEAKELGKLLASSTPTASDLPKLSHPKDEDKKYTATELYRKATWSVVLIENDSGSGSGVCVGRNDTILTNEHVIRGDGTVWVTPFIYKDKDIVKMPRIRASVVFRSEKDDVAVLKLDKAPDYLSPLPVASTDLTGGTKVYAIGSPGLGKDVLTQTISEGLVSSPKRMVDGVAWVQHSAAVNPGNSGGPLLDEHGQVVGIVTRKARLEGVSFAIRVETLRKIFQSP